MDINVVGSSTEGVVVTEDGETWILPEGNFLDVEDIAFELGDFSDLNILIDGEIDSGVGGGRTYSAAVGSGVDISLRIGRDASIETVDGGFSVVSDQVPTSFSTRLINEGFISAGETPIFLSNPNDGGRVVNAGTITSDFPTVTMFGPNPVFVNSGLVDSRANGVIMWGSDLRFSNSGDIVNTTFGLELIGDGFVENSGVVSAHLGAMFFAAERGKVVNSGELIAMSGGVALNAETESSFISLTNTGLIKGGRLPTTSNSVLFGGIGTELVRNSGEISGNNVMLNGGDDYFLGESGILDGDLFGGDGNDVLITGVTADIVFGGAGYDVIKTGDGDDMLDGGEGADDLYAGAGNDELTGGIGRDMLHGGDGSDLLDGGAAMDVLHGGGGDDALTGGGAADTFVFHRAAGFDGITDFTDGTDLIDVSAFGLAGFDDLAPAVGTVGGDATLNWAALGGQGVLVVAGAAGDLEVSDFIF